MVDINNPANYKPCKKKQFEVWACRPPMGTVVVDHLVQLRGSSILRSVGINSNLLLPGITSEWKAKGDRRFQAVLQAVQSGLVSIVNKPGQIVLCGTEGQFYITDYSFARNQYSVFSNNSYVSLDTIPELATKLFDWRRIRANQDYASKTMACFVPVSEMLAVGDQVVNGKGVPHGKGDFIVCSRLPNGQPDLNNRWVVNGLIFSDTYNNTGWTDFIQIGRQGVIEMPSSVLPRQEEVADLSSSLNKLFFIPCIKKSMQDCKYRFDIPGLAILVEQSQGKVLLRGSDGTSSAVAIEDIKKTRLYYKFMYMALVEQYKADNLILRPDFSSEFSGFLAGARLPDHFAFLLDLYKALKSLHWQLDYIDFGDFDGDWDSETRYCIQIDKTSQVWTLMQAGASFLGYNDDESSEYNYDCEPLEGFVDYKNGSYVGLAAKMRSAYRALVDSVAGNSSYLDRLRELGLAEKHLERSKDFFSDKSNSESLKRRAFNMIRWCYEIGKIFNITSYDDDMCIDFDYGEKSYEVYFYKPLGESGEYSVTYREPVADTRWFVYNDKVAFIRDLRSFDVPEKRAELRLPNSDYFFFYGKGWLGFASRENKVFIKTSWADNQVTSSEIEALCNVFVGLYGGSHVTCYGDWSPRFDNMVSHADEVSFDKFIFQMFGSLDKVMSRAGYNIDSDLPYGLKDRDYSVPKFEFVESNQVTGQVKGYVYCPMLDAKLPFSCSASTWRAIEVWSGPVGGRVVGDKFSKLHYHQLQLRAGNFWNLYDFKSLRLAFLKLNDEVFGGVFDPRFVVGAYNYNAKFNKDCDYSGYFNGKYIFLNAEYHSLQDTRHGFDYHTRSTLIHEMCHYYTVYKWGTCNENSGEDGGTFYGISEKYKDQWFCHGKHFGEAIQHAADVTKLPFYDLFGYGIGKVSAEKTRSWRNATGSHAKTTSPRCATYNGKSYCQYSLNESELFMCSTCGQVSTTSKTCHSQEMQSIGFGIFVTRCKQCGDIHIYRELVDLPDEVCSGYYAPIDVMGMLSVMPCQKCGGSVSAIAPGLSNEGSKEYMTDFRFTNRYRGHFYQIASGTLDKYNKWFNRVAGCNVSLSQESMPSVKFSILGDSFEEYYKLFFVSGNGNTIIGALYRDYGQNSKGYLIHKFRLRTDTDIVKFMDYFMRFVRKDFKTT